jgi:hypothetical protein
MNLLRRLAVLSPLCAIGLAAAFTTGCETFKTQQPEKIVTIHEIVRYPRGMKDLEREIPTFSGQRIWVNTNPFLHSKSIKAIEPVPCAGDPDYFDLKLTLDRHGALVWMQLSVGLARQSLAFVIDSVYYRSFKIEQPTQENELVVTIRGPFDKVTAEALKEHAKSNYEYYNTDAESSTFDLMEDEKE